MEIFLAFVVVFSTALILGVMLTLAANFMKVEENETVKQIRCVLPSVNCGACGYSGCDEYAKAIVLEGAKTNLCIPGSDCVAQEIAHIMGTEFEDVHELVAFVHCNGNCDVTTSKVHYDGQMTCRAANLIYGGPGKCRFGCLGCGDCVRACPTGAIYLDKGIAHVNPKVCIGCGLCVDDCPKNIISLVSAVSSVWVACSSEDKGAVSIKNCKNACIGCKKCEGVCPSGAIKVQNNLSTIDYSLCTACGNCVDACPTHCIHKA